MILIRTRTTKMKHWRMKKKLPKMRDQQQSKKTTKKAGQSLSAFSKFFKFYFKKYITKIQEYVNHYYDYEQKKRAKNDKKEGSSAGSTTMDIEDKQNEAFDEKPLLQIWEEYDVQKKFLSLLTFFKFISLNLSY